MQNKLTLETNLKLKCKYLYPEISPFPYISIIPQQYSDYQYTVLDLITGVINEGWEQKGCILLDKSQTILIVIKMNKKNI